MNNKTLMLIGIELAAGLSEGAVELVTPENGSFETGSLAPWVQTAGFDVGIPSGSGSDGNRCVTLKESTIRQDVDYTLTASEIITVKYDSLRGGSGYRRAVRILAKDGASYTTLSETLDPVGDTDWPSGFVSCRIEAAHAGSTLAIEVEGISGWCRFDNFRVYVTSPHQNRVRVQNGSFETGSLAPWVKTAGDDVGVSAGNGSTGNHMLSIKESAIRQDVSHVLTAGETLTLRYDSERGDSGSYNRSIRLLSKSGSTYTLMAESTEKFGNTDWPTAVLDYVVDPVYAGTELAIEIESISGWCSFDHFRVYSYLPGEKRIVGYMPRYRAIRPEQYTALTDVIAHYVVPNGSTGGFKVYSKDPETGETIYENKNGDPGLSSLMVAKIVGEAAPYGVRVGLGIGGGGVTVPFEELQPNGLTDIFATNVLNFAISYGLGSIALDWEHPGNQAEARYCAELCAALEHLLSPHGIELTSAHAAYAFKQPSIDAAEYSRPYLDAVYVMSYEHTFASFRNRFNTFIGAPGFTPAKVCPGLQFFGRDPARTLTKIYSQIVADNGGSIDPSVDKYNWAGTILNFTGQDTLRKICGHSASSGAGIMIWEIGMDVILSHTNSLVGTLYDEFGFTSGTGTPHWWLRAHGVHGDYENAVYNDPDLDGQATWKEYVTDTHPLDGTSRQDASVLPSGGLSFGTSASRSYSVSQCTNLVDGGWVPLAGHPVQGTGAPMEAPPSNGLDGAFYRLDVSLD